MDKVTDKLKVILDELDNFESQLEELPEKFGLINGIGSNFDYQRGKLRFDSWLKKYTQWLLKNIPGSEKEIKLLIYRFDNNNCNPEGSGYGTKNQMVETVFIRPFRNKIDSMREDILAGDFDLVHKEVHSTNASNNDYVSKSRIDELRGLSSKYDFSKLIALLTELNKAYENQMYYSVGCLVRVIIDHVPPVFGCSSFNEMANNYSGTKSFKEAMKSLNEQMRKVTDSYLHTQIREKEVAPVGQQVEARSPLDLLLSEIIRIS
ncbi:MAG: hypothetical protein COA96_01530 [SAR86 cluster bacterium]|uniref:Uncharacterized protein n=1 Tax=SAR86 cluster bacterium TaxID=2030880 RepID=A0A2A5B9T1_9GAMM|nr:MAG: hypothetical protein COA96_01530 [SAR86 cluster bacterium]